MAKQLPDNGKSKGGNAAARKQASPPNPRRQRLWRDLALIAIAPLLLYLLASLFTFSPQDQSWSQSGSITAPVHNMGGLAGAYLSALLLSLFGYVAFVLPFILGAIAWIALFGMDTDGDGQADLGPALRLIGMVAFLISATGLLFMRGVPAESLTDGAGGILGTLVGKSLLKLFGGLGGNLFLLVLFLTSVTLATGLSWFAVMERIGKYVLMLPDLFRRGGQQANEWQQTRAMREEREIVRKIDAVARAKREPVKIEPPAPAVVEKSERAKREQQIP